MDGSSRILFVLTDLIAPLVAGYLFHQRGLIRDRGINGLIRVNIVCFSTILALLSFWVLPLAPELLLLPVFGFLYVLLPGGIAQLFFARRYRNLLDRGAFMMSAMLVNIGTISGVCAFILYREPGFAYAQIIGTFQNFLLVVLCFPLAQYYRKKHDSQVQRIELRLSFREMFLTWNQLPVVGMGIGLLLDIGSVPRPELLADVFQILVHISAWVSLLPVGCLVDFHRARRFFRTVLNLLPLRFLIMPAIIWLLARPVFDDPVLFTTMILVALAPTAINAVLSSRLYQLNVDLAVASFLSTTVLYLVVVFPLLFLYLHWNGGTL